MSSSPSQFCESCFKVSAPQAPACSQLLPGAREHRYCLPLTSEETSENLFPADWVGVQTSCLSEAQEDSIHGPLCLG